MSYFSPVSFMILAFFRWVSLVSFLLCMVYALYSYLSEAHLACDLDLTLCLQVTFFPIFAPLLRIRFWLSWMISLAFHLGRSQSLSIGVVRGLSTWDLETDHWNLQSSSWNGRITADAQGCSSGVRWKMLWLAVVLRQSEAALVVAPRRRIH